MSAWDDYLDSARRLDTVRREAAAAEAAEAASVQAARQDLATAESALVAARTAYQKAKIELDRSVGSTLEANSISIESARAGVVQGAQ